MKKTINHTIGQSWIAAAVAVLSVGMVHAAQPNMVVIMVDDMGYECIGANGCTEYSTPVIDGLAMSGLRFENAHSTPVCTPTRTQIMSGRYGHRNYTRFGQFVESETCFAELLRDAGYATCMAGKWQLNGYDLDTTLDDFGFDEYALYNLPGFDNASYPGQGEGRYWYPDIYTNGQIRIATVETNYGPDIYTDFVIDFIDRKAGEQPFLVYFAMAQTHSPFVPTPHSSFTWPAGGAAEIYNTMDDPVWFKDMVEYTDHLTGRIVQALEDAGVRDNTLVIFTGDNGTHVSITTTTVNGDVRGGKNSVKKTGTHVPFIVSWPSQAYPTNEISALWDHSDMLPTLVELADAEMPTDRVIDGISIAPILRGETTEGERDAVFCEWFGGGRTKSTLRDFALDERYKYFINGSFYDMDNDPDQVASIAETNMTAEALAARDKLRSKIESVYARTDDDLQLAANPEFANGLSKWRFFGTGLAAANGMAVVTGNAGDSLDNRWLYQYCPAHPGQVYSAAVDVVAAGLDGGVAKAYLKVEFMDKDKAVLSTALSNEITSDTNPAQTIHLTTLCPLNTQLLRLSLVVDPLSGGDYSVAFDRVLLKAGKLRNPDAEFQNNAGWIESGADWWLSGGSEGASSGSFGFASTVYAGEAGIRTLSQTVQAVPGETYTVSADIRAGFSAPSIFANYVGSTSDNNDVASDGSLASRWRPYCGAKTSGVGYNGFFFFELPDLNGQHPTNIVATSFDGYLKYNTLGSAGATFNCDVYGFGRNSHSLFDTDYQTPGGPYEGTLVQDDYLTPGLPANTVYSISSTELRDLILSLYNPDGTPASNYLVLRLQPDWNNVLSTNALYRISSHGNGVDDPGDNEVAPVLTLAMGSNHVSSASSASVYAEFLDSSGGVLASHFGSSVSSNQTFTTQTLGGLVAPAGTEWIRVGGLVDVSSPPAVNENWGFDSFTLNDSVLPDLDRDGLPDADETAHGTETDRADTDADTMPDGWEVDNGLNPTNAADGVIFSDADIFSNVEEYIAGTDPQDSDSFFAITNMETTGSDIIIEWDSVAGRTYDVLWAAELDSGFLPMATGLDYPAASYMLPGATNQAGFFRINVQLK